MSRPRQDKHPDLTAANGELRAALKYLREHGYERRADEIAADVAQYMRLRTRTADNVPAEIDFP